MKRGGSARHSWPLRQSRGKNLLRHTQSSGAASCTEKLFQFCALIKTVNSASNKNAQGVSAGRASLALVCVLTLCESRVWAAENVGPVVALGAGVRAETLAVIVNDEDPVSVEIAEYYRKRRSIPTANIIHVAFKPGAPVMSAEDFARIKAQVDTHTPSAVQAFALTWSAPYRVDCMSITSAFAFGFDRGHCAQGCKATKFNSYFNSKSALPYYDHKIRPTMAVTGSSLEEAKKLIDRGIASDGTQPAGTAYLVTTPDKARSVRSSLFPLASKTVLPASGVLVAQVNAEYIENRRDVMFYFTGAVRVPKIESNTYLPGAIADHLTSAGGQLTNSGQMSILRWLDAGATASYGAVVEPCNIVAKFPHPAFVIGFYTRGASLIETYWKSVAMPGQGIFVGEPLARPY